MNNKTENELTEKKFYRKLCDLALYGSYGDLSEAVGILEKMETVESVDVFLKILLHHPKGKHCDECDRPRSEAVIPLLNLWKIAPEKIIPLIPIFSAFAINHEDIYDRLCGLGDEMGEEIMQKAFISGLNDYDHRVRGGALNTLYDNGMESHEIIPLLINAYKIETQPELQDWICKMLLENLNEEIAEMFFELIKTYKIDLNDPIELSDFYPDDETIKKTTPIFLRKWKEEKDETIRGLIQDLVDELINNFEGDVNKTFNKDEVKQLQEMEIIKK